MLKKNIVAIGCVLLMTTVGLSAELKVPSDYLTITSALQYINDGDTIRVGIGYSSMGEVFPLRLQRRVTLLGDPKNTPHLVGDGAHTVVSIECGGVDVNGFRISNGMGSEGINSMDGGGICIFVGPGETNPVTISHCLIEDNGCPTDETYDGCGGGIYCGGTYCTCFQINIFNCQIQGNMVRGCGGGAFCALLSNVRIENTIIQANSADDHGGGVYVDVFALVDLTSSHLIENSSPGDPLKADWGGKGGGLACESFGVFSAEDCVFSDNSALYFGGGIFTRGGLFYGEGLCDCDERSAGLFRCHMEKNRAGASGGGIYVGGSGILDLSETVLYWNDAGQDGGGVYVAGGAGGGWLSATNDCLLEGNESARHGGGIYLGPQTQGHFDSTRFLGNSCLWQGGALYCESDANGVLTDCLVTYNNAARGKGAGAYLESQSNLDLTHCTVVGNFSPHHRSGLYLDPNAVADITDSIFWHNAGGSIDANGANFNIAYSLNEDGADPNNHIIDGHPGYVGWGDLEILRVEAFPSGLIFGSGAASIPSLADLQIALDSYDFTLGLNSSCIGIASDGSNLGADTGSGGMAGHSIVDLNIGPGQYDIRGRNLSFIRDVNDLGPDAIIRNAVFGPLIPSKIRNIAITDETVFGGLTTRSDIQMENCWITDNTSLANGGGMYVAAGDCNIIECTLSDNASQGNGGGLFLNDDVTLSLTASYLERNHAINGGGCYVSSGTISTLAGNRIAENTCITGGGGLFLDVSSISSLQSDQVLCNTSQGLGAGIYTAGQILIVDANLIANVISSGKNRGGGLYIRQEGDVDISDSRIYENSAFRGGGIYVYGGKIICNNCDYTSNTGGYGGGLEITSSGTGSCSQSRFDKNNATHGGGAILFGSNGVAVMDCNFIENRAHYGGAVYCTSGNRSLFDRCHFFGNNAYINYGGCLVLRQSRSVFSRCSFIRSSAKTYGGMAYIYQDDASVFEQCTIDEATAGEDGGAFYINDTAHPTFLDIKVINATTVGNGGGFAILGNAYPQYNDVSIIHCWAVYGGGVYAGNDTQGLFEQCLFQGNHAYITSLSADGGGAFFTENAQAFLIRCQFRDNEAQDDGGGMAVADKARVDLMNTLFAGNTAVNAGGGVHLTSSSMGKLDNCTIIDNQAINSNGGGIYLETTCNVSLDSCIVSGNMPDGIRPEASPVVNYTCTQIPWLGLDNSLCNGVCNLDPNTFEPLDGSSTIDAGNPDPNLNDASLPPGKGGNRNDMGFTGGPYNSLAGSIPLDPNLVGWWTFDEVIGNWAMDYSGYGRHAILINGLSLLTTDQRQVLDFDGVDDYVSLPIGGLISTLTDSTFLVDVNFKGTEGNCQRFFDFGSNTSVYMFLTPNAWGNGSKRFAITTGGYPEQSVVVAPTILSTGWHHVAVVFQSGIITLYLDGMPAGSVDSLLTPSSLGVTSNNWLGRSQYSRDAYLNAQIDDFRIYNRALSQPELEALMQE